MKSHKSPMDEGMENLHGAEASASRLNGVMADAMERSVSIFGRSVQAFQQEGMRFLTRRIEHNAKAVQELGSCKSLPDLLVAQQRWFADMTRAYSEEWARYGDIVTEAMHESEKAADETKSSVRRASETH